MPLYAYQALGTQQTPTSGVLTADSPRHARDLLRAKGYAVQEIKEQNASKTSGFLASGARRRRATAFLRELATLLGVGVQLTEALSILANQAEVSFKPVVLALRDQVVQGRSLSDAMKQETQTFDSVACRVAEVGEQGGNLDQVLEHLADFRDRSDQLKGKLLGALAYPAIVLVVGTGVCIFLMTLVVPSLVGTLQEMGRDLPWITQAVKAVSDALVHWGWLVALGAAALGVAGWQLFKRPAIRMAWDKQLLKIPLLGGIHHKQQVARVGFVVGTLMRTGVPFEETLQVARGTLSNQHLQNSLAACEQAVRRGKDLGQALRQTEAWPESIVQVFALGQQSGKLPEMLDRLSKDQDQEAQRQANRLAGLLNPILIILLAVMVGTVAMAVILPILEAGAGAGQ